MSSRRFQCTRQRYRQWTGMGATGRMFLILVVLLGYGTPGFSQPHKYLIDPEHASFGFLIFHIGYAKTLGMFREISGSFTFDETSRWVTDVRVVVKTASVFTNHEKRDNHLRGSDFLDSDRYPEMIFTAYGAQLDASGKGRLAGSLTLLGQTRPLTLELTWNKSATYPIRTGLLRGKPYVTGVSRYPAPKRPSQRVCLGAGRFGSGR